VSKIESPSVYTIGDYRVATGGIDNTVCLKVLAGELISGAIANELKLWYFPLGGGKLSRTKQEQLDALKQFNITKDGIDRRILECQNRLNSWVQKYDKNAFPHIVFLRFCPTLRF